MKLRRITEQMVEQTVQKPDSKTLEDDGDTKFVKTIANRNIQVVGKYLADDRKWLVKSTWVRGEDDPKSWLRQMLDWVLQRLIRRRS